MISKEELQNRLEVMSACWQGEEVEWACKGELKWAKCWEREIFQWEKYTFRVKPAPPEPKEIWVNEEDQGYGKYREVLEDE